MDVNRVPFGAVVLVMLWVGACASSSSPPVALTIPEPPPRVAIAPVALVEVLPTENFAPRAPATATQDNGGTPSTRRAVVSSPAVPSPPAAPPPVSAPSPVATPPASTNLRSSGSGAPTTSPVQVREILTRASRKLDALNRRQFSAGKQADYDNARRFLLQSEAALKANNLMLAQSSAEKAEALADGLR